jgi:hypothetical protein
MPGTEPYIKPCNNCAKQIILGIDPTTNKWRPWDNYATKEKHNCKQVTDTTIPTAEKQENDFLEDDIKDLKKQVTDLEQKTSMVLWILEKVAKKVGVDDMIENQNG